MSLFEPFLDLCQFFLIQLDVGGMLFVRKSLIIELILQLFKPYLLVFNL